MSVINERHKEIKRRRHRQKKVGKLKAKYIKANPSEQQEIVRKLHELTPGANEIIARLEDRDRSVS